jgi:hypothetical protein
MKGVGLALIVGGWMLAVAGLLVSEELVVRGGAAVAGLVISLAGIGTLNGGHLEHAIWKTRGH